MKDTRIVGCLGGWCPVRVSCRHYVLPDLMPATDVRLCQRGYEDPELFSKYPPTTKEISCQSIPSTSS